MSFFAKKNLIIWICFLMVMGLSSCQGQTLESSPGQTSESSPYSVSESTAASPRDNAPVPSPAYVFYYLDFSVYGYSNRTVYLDREGALITTLPDSAEFIWDSFSGEALYYQVRSGREVHLYSLDGRYLESSSAGYGSSSVGPYVLRGTKKSDFLWFASCCDLVDPETGRCLLKDIYNCVSLDNDKVLILNEAYEAAYLMDKQGQIEAWPGEEACQYMYYSDGLLFLQSSQRDYYVYDGEAKLLKKIEAAGRDMFLQRGAGLESMIMAQRDGLLEIWDIRRDAYFALGKDTDLFKRGEDFYIQSTGNLLWSGGRLYDMEGHLIREFKEIYATKDPAMPLVAFQGSTVYVLDESGEILREKVVPGLEWVEAYTLSQGSACIPCTISSKGAKGEEYRNQYILLDPMLEPISEEIFYGIEEVEAGLLKLYVSVNNYGPTQCLLMDETGRVLIRNIRSAGWAVDGQRGEYIAVAQGPYIGLIDREGNWIRKNRIYDLPPGQYIDD